MDGSSNHDLVLRGARTIDPESGLDAVCDVAVTDGRIAAVVPPDAEDVSGRVDLDATGSVLAPGFIDLHSHCNDLPSLWLQVCDGVTTALDLEAGSLPVARAYAQAAWDGRPVHYGYSASWALARMAACGLDSAGGLREFLRLVDVPAWHRPATGPERQAVLGRIGSELADGALGIGVLLGYCEESEAGEYLEVAHLAAAAGVPTFTHVRELGRVDSGLMGAAEVVTAALASGAHMHVCHVNSTSLRHVDQVTELIGRARQQGLRVTTEAYPYGSGATGIGAAFLDPSTLTQHGLEPYDIRYLRTGERPATHRRLAELRADDPGGLAVIDYLDESNDEDVGFLTRALLFDDTAVASDAMPLVVGSGIPALGADWPIQPGVVTHPRTAGTFARVLRWYVRELGLLSLPEAIRRCTLVPARILEQVAPAMTRKGRVQVGADADLVVFDPVCVADRSTYDDPVRASTGIRHVLVAGEFVVREGILDTSARPGRPVRGVAT
jgi:hypothetical protein